MHKLLVPLLLILLCGCAPSLPNPLALDPATAQTAIEERLHDLFPAVPIMNISVLGIERVPEGTLVFFTYETTNDVGANVIAIQRWA